MADATTAGGGPEANLAFGHYRVLRGPDDAIWELGRGAMGVTYKARDDRLRIDVALKVIAPGQVDDPKTQALFLREARAAARVRHPNVASVVFLNDTPGNFFYAMEFVAGESLADWLRTRGPLPPALAIGFAVQIARGLGAIHAQHIVHRDLKPANVMIVAADAEKMRAGSDSDPEAWQIKIIDFGLARGFDGVGLGTEADAQTTGFRGTALYASPEQCEERGMLDGRSDLYSLGCILWEMLLGVPPFRARTHREILNQHVALPAPVERLAHLSPGLQGVLARLLAKDPADRFPDADMVVKALERCPERTAPRDTKIDVVGVTTRDAEHVVGSVQAATPASPKRSIRIGLAILFVALLIAGATWFFLRGRTAAPAEVATTPRVAATPPAISPSPAPAELQGKTIAVLPFQNLSGRPEDAYLADGLQEEVLNALARLRDLKVISRTSVMEYRGKERNIREIGQRLGAGSILEGSVRREGNTLRLTVQLIDARNDQHLFATSYDRELNKILDLQSTVARQIADALAATLSRQERGELDRVATNNGDAYDRFLHATALYRQPVPGDDFGVVEPKRLLEEAIRLDPDYADAYALLSRAYTQSRFFQGRQEDGAAAKKALDQAFAKDPKSPEVLIARGLYAMYVAKNLDQALVDLKAVANMRPNSSEALQALGYALRRSGQMEDALGYFVRSWDLDPLNQAFADGPITTLFGLRRFPEAIVQTQLYTARFPNDPGSYIARGRLRSRLEGSAEPLKAALRDYGGMLEVNERHQVEARIAVIEGRHLDAVHALSKIPEADKSLETEKYIACLYYAAGELALAEQVFRRLESKVLELQASEPNKELTLENLSALALAQSMLGKHEAALVTSESACKLFPEVGDATNGPAASYVRSIVLVRAGRTEEGYKEVARLMRVPFGAPNMVFDDGDFISLLTKGDPRFDELNYHPPRL